jgi:hypothetical protein
MTLERAEQEEKHKLSSCVTDLGMQIDRRERNSLNADFSNAVAMEKASKTTVAGCARRRAS